GNIVTNMRVGDEADTLCGHLLNTAVHHMLFQLEIGNAIHQQSADAIGFFVYSYRVSGTAELLGCSQASGTGADNRNLLAAAKGWRLGMDPSLLERVVDNVLFDLLNGNRRLIDAQHAGGFAGGRADTAGKLGKIISGMQLPDGFLPAATIDQVIPVR